MRLTFYNRTKLSAIFCIATANFIHICGLLNAQPVLTFNTAPASIRDVAFSYDGKYFATAGQQVILWSATEKKLLRNLTGFITRIQSVTFSPKDNLIAGSGEKQGVIIWNTITGKQIRVLPNVPTNDVCFSSDGKYLACAGQGGIEIISTSDFSAFRTFGNTKTFLKVDFSPDSKMVIAADNSGRISKYNIQTGLLAFKITAHSKSISDLRFSVSGNFILSTAWDSKIKVWNSDNGEILSILDSKFGTNNASFYSNDSQIISGGYDGILTFTDWRNGMKLKTITGTLNDINRISVNPITNDLITSGESAKLDYWSFPADKPEWSIKPAEGAASSTNFRALAVHPKNVMIATAGYSGVIKILNPNAQDYVTEINTQSQNIQNLRFNNQGDLLISAGYKIKLWDVATYKSKGELRGYNDYIINDIELASNDSILYSIGNKPAIRIWNLHSKRQIGKIKTKRNCTSIALSSGGDKIIGGYKNGEYQVWDLKTHKLIYTAKISDSRIADISASSDDSILAFSTFNGKIIICSLKSGKTIRTLNAGSSMMAGYKYSDYLSQNVRLSPDNQYAISARPNGSVERLHWQTGQCDTLGVHTGFACNSEFTANNKFIVSIGEDAVIKIWNAQSLKELVFVTFSNNSENYYVVTTPQGHFFETPKPWNMVTMLLTPLSCPCQPILNKTLPPVY